VREVFYPLPFDDQTITGGSPGGWSASVEGVIVGAAATQKLSPGALLGERYEIIQLLGQGGMEAVYKADDRKLDRQVALKVIRADMAANPEILKRFKQEIILARQITHRNVVRIFDLGQADGIKFITMEYIEGEGYSADVLNKLCYALKCTPGDLLVWHPDRFPRLKRKSK
jgi:DNA-binding Xre family transcriptional regulator